LLGPYEKALSSSILDDLKNPAKTQPEEISEVLLPSKVPYQFHSTISNKSSW
jgi:hypothetical protein